MTTTTPNGSLTNTANPTSIVADRTLTLVYGPEHQRVRQDVKLSNNAHGHIEAGLSTVGFNFLCKRPSGFNHLNALFLGIFLHRCHVQVSASSAVSFKKYFLKTAGIASLLGAYPLLFKHAPLALARSGFGGLSQHFSTALDTVCGDSLKEASDAVHRVVIAYIERDDLLVLNQQLQRDAVKKVDGRRMNAFLAARQCTQTQRRVVRVDLQQCQRFGVLVFQPRVALEKSHNAAGVAICENQGLRHQAFALALQLPGAVDSA